MGSNSPVKFEGKLLNEEKVGKELELKEELVLKPDYVHSSKERLTKGKEILEPYEVDGWKGDIDDLWDSHRWEGDYVRVNFRRYV